MRIHFYGNVLNWAYLFGKYFRAKGHEVRVFLNRRERIQLYRPEWEDEELGRGLPEWVEVVDVQMGRLLAPRKPERDFLSRLGECDFIQTFGEHALWAWRTRTPYGVLSYGGDLEIIPFHRRTPKSLVLAALIKRAFRQSAFFVYAIPSHRALIKRLGLRRALFNPHAVPVDTAKYAPLPEPERQFLRKNYPHQYVFFHGARQEWTFKDANDKANDRLFKAFARFVKEYCSDSLLIAVERGRDVERSKQLVAHLGIGNKVLWMQELRKSELVKMLNSVDAFFDQFSHGYYGVAVLEALSCEVPSFVYINRREAQEISLPPVVNVFTEEEICQGMKAFADHKKLSALGKTSREWVLEHHRWEKVVEWYEELYAKALH